MNHRHVRPLLRFWWLVVLGVGVAMLAGVASIAHISASVPPKVTYRSRPKYTATELMLLTSAQDPGTRTSVAGSVRKSATAQSQSKQPSGKHLSTQVASTTPATSAYGVLVNAAQYYPHLIPSDPVLAVRTHMFGELRGTVTAKAVNSVQTASGKYKAGNVPIIEIDAVAGQPGKAIKLAKSTVTAFSTWLSKDQTKNGIPTSERILVATLDVPTKAVSSGGPKKTIAIVVALAVLAAFVGLAFVLDKAPVRVPPSKPAVDDVDEEELVHALEIPANGMAGKNDQDKRRGKAGTLSARLPEDVLGSPREP